MFGSSSCQPLDIIKLWRAVSVINLINNSSINLVVTANKNMLTNNLEHSFIQSSIKSITHKTDYFIINSSKFCSHRLGSSLPGLHKLDLPLSPQSTPAEMFWCTCLGGWDQQNWKHFLINFLAISGTFPLQKIN